MISLPYIHGKPFVNALLNDLLLDVECLVDSGADYSVFPASLGEKAGIDFSEYEPLEGHISGLNGALTCRCWKAPVKINFPGFESSLVIEAIFADSQEVGNLLGRKTFFDKFKSVNFDERRKLVTFVA